MNMSDNISLISISPCLNLKVVESILMNSDAIIIEAYGMGNIPSKNQKLMSLIQKSLNANKVIVILSQCHKGSVNDLYEAGRALTDLGAVLG